METCIRSITIVSLLLLASCVESVDEDVDSSREACRSYCETLVDCEVTDWKEVDACVSDCATDEADTCQRAMDDLYRCVAPLSCQAAFDYVGAYGNPYPCSPEEDAALQACI